jgi:hypothetical protein
MGDFANGPTETPVRPGDWYANADGVDWLPDKAAEGGGGVGGVSACRVRIGRAKKSIERAAPDRVTHFNSECDRLAIRQHPGPPRRLPDGPSAR